MKRINIAYFGSPDFSARFLEKLITNVSMYRYIEVKLVITQPDRKVGRKQILTPTPVKTIALKYGLEVLEIKNLKIENSLKIESRKLREKISKVDIVLVYAYSAIIPKEFLTLPKYGFWCIHPSLLPKYRGTSPMATALINGDKKTGVTIIKMDEKIDHGPIIAQEEYKILPTDRRPDLENKLTNMAFKMFKKLMGEDTFFETIAWGPDNRGEAVEKNGIEPLKEQNHTQATYTKKLAKADGFIEISNFKSQISNSSEKLFNLFRGLFPWPGIWTLLPNGKRLKIIDTNLVRNKNFCSLQIKRVQLEGKKEVDFETFNKAYKIF